MGFKDFCRKDKTRKVINVICRLFFSLFYKRKFLIGKHFDDSFVGWLWAYRNLGTRLFGENRKIPWPMNKYSTIYKAENIIFDQSSINCFQQKGCYFQNFNARIIIGKNVWIAPNVGLITSNHDIEDLTEHEVGKDIIIKDNCWIGMNSVILPGVELGENTIVGAGAVVTKSFKDGNCILVGVPAEIKNRIK
jgi:acetyltransferase-like isoleucine patch superfamily enzyme